MGFFVVAFSVFILVCEEVYEFYCLYPRKNVIFKNNVLPENVPKTMWLQDIPLGLQVLSVINSASLKWNAKENSK